MNPNYQRLQEAPQSGGPINESEFMKAFTSKMQDYMFEQQKVETDAEKLERNQKYKKPAFIVNDMQNSYIDMKKSFEYVGDNSTFQKRITTILMIQWIAFSYLVNSMAYLFRSPTFLCKFPMTDIYYTCDHNTACFYMQYDMAKVVFGNIQFLNFNQMSITQEFNLICGNQNFAPFAQSMFFFGGFISGYIFSYISAKIGRRSILLIILVMQIMAILMCAFAPSLEIFIIGYFFIGFSMFGYETSVYIYIGQISAIRFRTISINMLTMVWAGTPIFFPLTTMISSWRYVFMIFAGLLLITFPLAYKCFLQSPRYLVSKKCYAQARNIFRQISVIDKRPPYSFNLLQQIQYQNQSYLNYNRGRNEVANFLVDMLIQDEKKTKSYNYLDLFKFQSLKKITLVLMYWWMFRFFLYFGLNLALQSILHSGLVLTGVIAVAAIVEVIGSFGITLMTTILYRKYKLDIMKTSLFMITVSCILMWFLKIESACKGGNNIDDYKLCYQLILIIILVIIIKFFNTVFFSGLIGYYSEVFPTPVRSLGCGFTLTFGRLGTIIVPFYINYMKVGYPQKNSLCFMAPFGLAAYLLCCIMPYTEDQGMKENIQQQVEKQNMIEMNNM